MDQRTRKSSSSRTDNGPHEELLGTPGNLHDNTRNGNNRRIGFINGHQFYNFSRLGASSVLHGLYVFAGFTLMNAVMTYNIWILVVVSLGMGLGYFLFGNSRRYDFLMESVTSSATTCIVDFETSGGGDALIMSASSGGVS